MAIFKEDIVDIDLETGKIYRSFLSHTIGHKDTNADRFGVRVFRAGAAEDLKGVNCQAIFMAPDGQNIALTSHGTVSGNVAYVTLPQACYNVEGQFCLAIKLVGGGITGTVRIVDGMVDRTGATGAVAPTEAVPTYQEILAVYAQMQEDVADYESVVANQNDQINSLKSAISPDDITKYSYEIGSIDNDDGTNVSSTKKIRTGMIYANVGDVITSSYEFRVLFYIQRLGNGTYYDKSLSDTGFSKESFTVPKNGFIRIVAHKDDDSVLSDADVLKIRQSTYIIHTYNSNELVEQSLVRTMVFSDESFGKDWTAFFNSKMSVIKQGTRFRFVNSSTQFNYFYALNADELYTASYSSGIETIDKKAFTINKFKTGRRYRISAKIHRNNFGNNSSSLRVYGYDGENVVMSAFMSLTPFYTDNTQILSTEFNGNDSYLYSIVYYQPSNILLDVDFSYAIEDITEEYMAREYKKTRLNLENGGYSGSTGTRDASNRIRLGVPFFAGKGTRINFSIGDLEWMLWELSSSSRTGGNVLTNSSWTSAESQDIWTVRNDCYIMLAFRFADDSAISVTDFSYDYYVRVIVGGGTAITTLADYYHFADNDFNAKGEAYASLLKTGAGIDSFMFFTDSHYCGSPNWRTNLATGLMNLGAYYKTSPLDFCVFGGDVLTGTSPYNTQITAEHAMYYLTYQDQMSRETFGADRYFPMVGNHDYNYQANDLLNEDNMVNAMFRKEGKAYYAHKGNNAMFYFLNTGLNKTSGGSYTVPMDEYKWKQIEWLANKLINDDADHSVILMHIIRNNNSGQPEFSLFTNANELASAYNSHSTITLNGETYDFTGCTGRVEMFLAGHLHGDGFNITKNGIPCIMRSNTTHGSVNPTADMVFCDWNERTVYFKKIGDGDDLTVDLDNYDPTAASVDSAVNNE